MRCIGAVLNNHDIPANAGMSIFAHASDFLLNRLTLELAEIQVLIETLLV